MRPPLSGSARAAGWRSRWTAGRRSGSEKSRGASPSTLTVTSSPSSRAEARRFSPVPPAAARIALARAIPASGPVAAAARAPSCAAAAATERACA